MTRLQNIIVFSTACFTSLAISLVLYMIHPALAFIYATWLLFSHSLYQYLGHAKYARSGLRLLNNIKLAFHVFRRTLSLHFRR